MTKLKFYVCLLVWVPAFVWGDEIALHKVLDRVQALESSIRQLQAQISHVNNPDTPTHSIFNNENAERSVVSTASDDIALNPSMFKETGGPSVRLYLLNTNLKLGFNAYMTCVCANR